MRRTVLTALTSVLILAGTASGPAHGAETGTGGAGSPSPDAGLPQDPGQAPSSGATGGAGYNRRIREEGRRARERRGRPVLAMFEVSRSSLFAYGEPATVSYQIKDHSRFVRVRLAFVRARDGHATHRVDLGRRRTGITHSYRWRGTDERRFAPQGEYRIRLKVRDPTGNRLVRSSQSLGGTPINFATHRFPVAGPHSFGDADSRFDAPRNGHRHQGQDIAAAEGTPVLAPRAGIVVWRAYQAEGAGYYLVLAGEGEPYHYVFMHLQRGSILVNEGDHVQTGQAIARVGNTGGSSGPHLHFEIWHGPWSNGGRPIDPLPKLLAWRGAS